MTNFCFELETDGEGHEEFIRTEISKAIGQAERDWNRQREIRAEANDIDSWMRDKPCVRASTYLAEGEEINKFSPNIVRRFDFMDDPPVYMKGSKAQIDYKYNRTYGWNGHSAEWEEKVIERYLRRTGYTSMSIRHIHNKLDELITRTCGVGIHHKTRAAMLRNLGWPETRGVGWRIAYIRGIRHRVYDMADWKLLKRQFRLLAKVERLAA